LLIHIGSFRRKTNKPGIRKTKNKHEAEDSRVGAAHVPAPNDAASCPVPKGTEQAMMRKIAVALTAAAVMTAWSTSDASAMRGGGMGRGGMGGGVARAASFHPMSVGAFARPVGIASVARPVAFANPVAFAHPVAFSHRFAFRHHFFRHRFAFIGAYPYAYDDYCYTRVWTPWGWRWQYACY
jgi:hypothetical protein